MKLLDSWYAEFKDPSANSDKFYFLTLYSDAADPKAPVKLLCQHGRNGSHGVEQERYASTDMTYARAQFAKIRGDKIKKGYTPKTTPQFLNQVVAGRTGMAAATVGSLAPSPLSPPVEIPASGFVKMIADRSYVIQSRPPQPGTPAAILIDSKVDARLLHDPNNANIPFGTTWAKELRLDQLRGFGGVSPLIVEGLVVTIKDVAHFIPLDVLVYAGDDVTGFDFGSRWALLNEAMAELRGNAAGPAFERWLMPVPLSATTAAQTNSAELMLRHGTATHGSESPLVQAA